MSGTEENILNTIPDLGDDAAGDSSSGGSADSGGAQTSAQPRKVAVTAPRVRNLLKQVAKAAQVNNLRQQCDAGTTGCLKSPTRTILIPVI
jgi:hypothetical protein